MHNLNIPFTSKSYLIYSLQIISLHPNLYTPRIIQQLRYHNSLQTMQYHLLPCRINQYPLNLLIMFNPAH